MNPIASIIIPAHNEEAVISVCLGHLLADAAPGELDVIVVCNACTDRTAEVASRCGVRVLHTPVGSKTAAINLGAAQARTFPLVVVDADVRISADSVRALVLELHRSGALIASPRVSVDTTHSSWPVRAYYAVWLTLPYFNKAIGGGVYAISKTGWEHIGSLPRITADDAFVRLKFPITERSVVSQATFIVTAPTDLRSLICIKTRSRRGNLELLKVLPELRRDDAQGNRRHLLRLMLWPSYWLSLLLYLFVVVVTWCLAHWRHLRGAHAQWERDDSSRRLITMGLK